MSGNGGEAGHRRLALYRGKAAGSDTHMGDELEAESHRGSPRLIGALVYIVILCALQLAITVVLAAILLDFAIAGSMREALRYTVTDAPRQFAFIAAALVLAATAVRYTAEANIEMVLPELFDAPGNIGTVARLVPRAMAFVIGWSVGYPLLQLAYDQLVGATGVLGGTDQGDRALLFGIAAVGIGTLVAVARSLHDGQAGFTTARSSFLLRALMALVPLAAVVVLTGTVLGLIPTDSWDRFPGVGHDAVARYSDPDTSRAVYRMVTEGLALLLCALAARLGFAIVISLLLPGKTGSKGLGGLIATIVPRVAAGLVGFTAAYEVLLAGVGQTHAGVQWVYGIALGFAAIGLLAALANWPSPNGDETSTVFQRTGGRWLLAADRMAALGGGWRALFMTLPVLGVLVFLFFLDTTQVARAQTLGPIAILLAWGFTAAALFAPIAYLSQMTKMPLLLILIVCGVAFAAFDLNDNHQIRGASTVRSHHHQISAGDIGGHYLEHLNLGDWLKSRRDWRAYDHYPIFLVATEGGGIRAAYFTASVLSALEQKCPGFAQHVLAVSSVSGGSVGSAVFAAESAQDTTNVDAAGCHLGPMAAGAQLKRARAILATDLLSPLMGASLFPDALQRILPLPFRAFDRARALEYALEDGWRHANQGCKACDPELMSKPVAALYANSDPRKPVPHMFLNTTEAGTGRTVPFATWDIGDLAVPDRSVSGAEEAALPPATLVPVQNLMRRDDVALSTAAMLSARFPYLTPAAKLGNTGHYVDGGYFENSGTWLLSGVAQNLIGQRLDYHAEDGDKDLEQAVQNAVIIVVVIRSEPCTRTAEGVGCDEEIFHGDADSTLNEMLSPLRALLATRDKRAQYSINDLGAVTALIQRLTGAASVSTTSTSPKSGGMQCNEILCSVTIRFYNAPNAEVPLTWMLSSGARHSMDNAVDRILADDLAAPPPAKPPLGDRIEGSYRQVLCLLQEGKGMAPCQTAATKP